MDTVHPHVRGEHPSVFGVDPRIDGSSPRPWGTPARLALVMSRQRFIPTSVGNTVIVCSARYSPPVHPHVRGEHIK